MKCKKLHSWIAAFGLLCTLFVGRVSAQTWFNLNANLTGMQQSSIAWGDYDNDGDLDLVIAGWASKVIGTPTYSHIYRNDFGVFENINAGLTGLQAGALAWGDYDNDGDLDLAISGQTNTTGTTRLTLIYRNDEGVFTNIAAGLPGVNNGSLAWADFDNDGDLDLALAGWTGTERITRIYRNDNATAFVNSGAAFMGIHYGEIAAADYDNDGDHDLAITGWNGTSAVAKVYRNDSGTFADINADLTAVSNSALSWGDYNNDGIFDLALSGYEGVGSFGNEVFSSRVYANDLDAFFDAGVGLEGTDGRGNVENGSIAWGDYDNDGLSDIVLCGWTNGIQDGIATRVTRILHNNDENGPFTDIAAGLGAVQHGAAIWGDFDGDWDLDVANAGQVGGSSWEISRVHRNDVAGANFPPLAPIQLAPLVDGDSVTFAWTPATDAETPPGGLTYNLRVGTSPGTDDVFCSMADPVNGNRLLPANGNAQKRLSWTLHGLSGTLYWSVQAIDNAFVGGAWAPESTVTISDLLGDIDGDGDVDMVDSTLFIAALLGQNPDANQVAASDLNGSGSANGQDVQLMVDALVAP